MIAGSNGAGRRGRWSLLAGLLALLGSVPVAAQQPVLLVFTSDLGPRASAMVEAFASSAGIAVQTRYLVDGPERAADVRARLEGFQPSMVFVVGDTALSMASTDFGDVPVVYADVEQLELIEGRVDLVGLDRRSDPIFSVARIRQALPSVRRIGALRASTDVDDYWGYLERACKGSGIDVDVRVVAAGADPAEQVQALKGKVDLLWLQQSPQLWTEASVSAVLSAADDVNLPVLGFEPDQLVNDPPATVVLVGDPASLGLAAAEVARSIVLRGVDPGAVSVPMVEPDLLGNAARLRLRRLGLTRVRVDVIDGWETQ